MRQSGECDRCESRGCECCMQFREAWSPGSIYRPGDAVPYEGSSYVAIHPNQDDPPPSSNWALIASRGKDGPAGAAGPQGPRGEVGGGASTVLNFAFKSNDNLSLTPEGVDVARMTVSAGSWVIMATITFWNQDGDAQNWTLELRRDSALLSNVYGRAPNGDSPANGDRGMILAAYTAQVDTTLTILAYGFNILVDRRPAASSFIAMKVGDIVPV